MTKWGRGIALILAGALAGFLAGLFGVGGGLIVVPALMTILGMDQRRAAATSLVAIAPAAVVGAISYGSRGQLSLIAAVCLIAGSLVGARIGVRLLHWISARVLPWLFVGFIVLVFISQQIVLPVRESEVHINVVNAIILALVGLLAGILSGLIGVGGGLVVVPGMQIALGVGDLLARGTSLAMMIPTTLMGTWANLKRGNVDIQAGLSVGIVAAICSPLGVATAAHLSVRAGAIAFYAFLVFAAVSVLYRGRSHK